MTSQNLTYSLHKLVFLMDKLADRVLRDKLGLTFSQFKILMAIDHRDACQKDVAKFWDMTEAAVSRQVDLLLQKKLIVKTENSGNRRQFLLKLTGVGDKLLTKSFKLVDDKYDEIYSHVDQKKRKILADALATYLGFLCQNYDK